MSDTLMISVSGMRGIVGKDLTPDLVARYAAALGAWAIERGGAPRVVLGRDARTSGEMFARAASSGLMSVGVEVVDVGIAPTPAVQMAVEHHHAGAGLILTASHNPIEWNALKLLGPDGVFLDAASGARVRAIAEAGPPRADWSRVGGVVHDADAVTRHLDAVLALPLIDVEGIRRARMTVALDCVRGAGGTSIPPLLERLGCVMHGIHLETDGRFPHPPEPIPENLGDLGALVRRTGAAIGLAVDPDVDRLALVDETGTAIGEDYTLAFAIRALGRERLEGQTVVVNLSTSLVVEDAARACGAAFVRAPVGEAHVVGVMRRVGALIGGEGNGGVILPQLHAGRDAPLGIALSLQYVARSMQSVSAIVASMPRYSIVKGKGPRGADLAKLYMALKQRFADATVDEQDGLRLAWEGRWLHVRPSGTEPIIRYIAEARSAEDAEQMIAAAKDTKGG